MEFPKTPAEMAEAAHWGFEPIEKHPGYFIDAGGTVWSSRVRMAAPRPRKGAEFTVGESIRPLRPMNDSDGYKVVTMDGKNFHVHNLILEAFVGPRPEGLQACHGNGIRSDNRVQNLRWGTPKDNARDRDAHGNTIRGERSAQAKLSEAQVREIRALRALGVHIVDLARRYGITHSYVSAIAKGRVWVHIPIVPGTATPHWTTCPNADDFRKSR